MLLSVTGNRADDRRYERATLHLMLTVPLQHGRLDLGAVMILTLLIDQSDESVPIY